MISDITIGQYYPADSPVHRLDPRMKIFLTTLYIVVIFFAKGVVGYAVTVGFVVLVTLLSRVPLRLMLRTLKPLWFFIALTLILNLLMTQGETLLWEWQFIRLTQEGLVNALTLSVRLICLILGASLLTLTTSPIALTDGIERVLGPLKVIRFPAHELAMMMTIALRFIPTLLEETDKIMKAQKARGADFDTGGIFKRAKALVPLLVPLFVSAFRRADELAMAMEARCYRGGKGRTRMKVLHLVRLDYVSLLVTLCWSAVIFLDRCWVWR